MNEEMNNFGMDNDNYGFDEESKEDWEFDLKSFGLGVLADEVANFGLRALKSRLSGKKKKFKLGWYSEDDDEEDEVPKKKRNEEDNNK